MENEMSLDGYGVENLSFEDKKEINAGGWLADAIAGAVSYVKCGCWTEAMGKAYRGASFTVFPGNEK
jgi:hypothetical protein